MSGSINSKFRLNGSICTRVTPFKVTLGRHFRSSHPTYQMWLPATVSPIFMCTDLPDLWIFRIFNSLLWSELLLRLSISSDSPSVVPFSLSSFFTSAVVASVPVAVSYLSNEAIPSLFLSFPDTCEQSLSAFVLICCNILTTDNISFPFDSVTVSVD